MNSSKTQVNQKLKSLNRRIVNINKRLTNNAPVAISSKNGNRGRDYYSTKGKERISNVSVLSKDYHVVDSFINPANSSLFPWLSGIGKKYDLYHFRKLRFTYVPALPTSEEGNVYIGLDYNTLDPSPKSSTELCQLSHWTMNVVWKPSSITVDLDSIKWLYTRQGPVANADYKTYDLGRVFFATEGISFTGTVGYVEVEYDVEFKRRQPDYVIENIPTSDIYSPIASIVTDAIPSAGYSTVFDSSSYSNSSVISISSSSGYFKVSKSLKALLFAYYRGNNQNVVITPVIGKSIDNNSYTFITNSKPGYIIDFEPDTYYKIYNGYDSAERPYVVCLVVVGN